MEGGVETYTPYLQRRSRRHSIFLSYLIARSRFKDVTPTFILERLEMSILARQYLSAPVANTFPCAFR